MIGQILAGESFEFWSLATTRVIGLVGCVYAFSTVFHIVVTQPPKGHRTIPRPILAFALFWLAVLICIFGYLLVTGNEAITVGLFRAVYGMALVWAIVGLAWILSIGRSAWKRAEITQQQAVIDEIIREYVRKMHER